MKPEIYQALSQLNSGFEQIAAALKQLHGKGIITDDYVHEQTVRLSETCAAVNVHIIDRLSNREIEDKDHFGKMRVTIEAQAKT